MEMQAAYYDPDLTSPAETLELYCARMSWTQDIGQRKSAWALIGHMSFSGYTMVRLLGTIDTISILKSVESMFEELCGVPMRILAYQDRCFDSRGRPFDVVFNPAFGLFATHFNCDFEFSTSDSLDRQKASLANSTTVHKFLHDVASQHLSLAQMQVALNDKLRLSNGLSPENSDANSAVNLFLEFESQKLGAIPRNSFRVEQFERVTVRQDAHVRFSQKYYSLNRSLAGKTVDAVATDTDVLFFLNGQLVEKHPRIYETTVVRRTKPQHKVAPSQLSVYGKYYMEEARLVGPHVEKAIAQIVAEGQGFIDYRRIWGILNLTKTLPSTVVNEACRRCLESKTITFRKVKNLANLLSSPYR